MKSYYLVQEAFIRCDGGIITVDQAIVESVQDAESYIKFHKNHDTEKNKVLWTYKKVTFYEPSIIKIFELDL